jgi:NAD(P)-dependent dehydrogenase (short-subunit alcohol dehydrogenase family)
MEHEREPRRVWLITGASRGFGAEIAAAALAVGDAVVATARSTTPVIKRLGERSELLALRVDVTNEPSMAAAVREAISTFGCIDVLVNNAGYGLVGAVEETSFDDIRKIYETNVFGLLGMTRAALPQMRRQRSGRIINMSSVGGYRSLAGYGIYCSTKFAVEAISEALSAELAPLGIRVIIVEPGYFRTDFLDATSFVESSTRIDDYDVTSGQTRESARERNHQQLGDPVKLARTLVELARSPSPPLRLPLGTDAVDAIEAKNAFVARELDAWRRLSTWTDFPASPA